MDLAKEIGAIRGCALLNLFEIDATDMNLNMSTHASGLRDDLIKWQVNKINQVRVLQIFYRPKSSIKFPYIFLQLKVDTNRKWNREICDQFDKMATRLGEIPDKTRELVELQRYLKASMTETLPVIKNLH